MPTLALTMGDPAGVGGELTVKAWLARHAIGPTFCALDDPDRLGALANAMGVRMPIREINAPEQAQEIFPAALPVLPVRLANPPHPGKPDPANAPAIIEAIRLGAELALAGRIGGIVTNPINKAALYHAGFAHPGHTEFLAELTGATNQPVMMLACPALRVVPVTVHASLRKAIAMLTTDSIVEVGRIPHAALRDQFGIAPPRLAVAGLNPHAGEGGALGDDEEKIIVPAMNILRKRGISVTGPWPPDTMFTEAARANYDAAICMYHDQALIPLKTIDMHHGVNVTLGLPIVRTSPDHGTAYDIAGKGLADPSSLIAALDLAAQLALTRAGRAC
jgi:4-hydroxythreonine-4-phosphate dehydrogenase